MGGAVWCVVKRGMDGLGAKTHTRTNRTNRTTAHSLQSSPVQARTAAEGLGAGVAADELAAVAAPAAVDLAALLDGEGAVVVRVVAVLADGHVQQRVQPQPRLVLDPPPAPRARDVHPRHVVPPLPLLLPLPMLLLLLPPPPLLAPVHACCLLLLAAAGAGPPVCEEDSGVWGNRSASPFSCPAVRCARPWGPCVSKSSTRCARVCWCCSSARARARSTGASAKTPVD